MHILALIPLFHLFLSAGGNVLIIHPFYGGSHILTLRRLADALTEKNHEVKVIRWLEVNTYPPLTNPKISEIVLSVNNSDGRLPYVTPESAGRFYLPGKLIWENGLSLKVFALDGYNVLRAYCQELLSSEGLFHRLKQENFKVVIVDLLYNECGMALAYKLGVPAVGFWGFNFVSGPAAHTAAFNPPSSLPQTFSSLSDSMSFMERVRNTLYFIGIHTLMQIEFVLTNSVIQNHVPDCPHPSELLTNISGMLINSHPAVDYPRLLPPSFVEVGGLHLKPQKTLPQDILDFMNSSGEHGVILFSLGFTFNSSFVPRKVYEDYFKAFGRLKQKVIVKTNGVPSHLPPNVKIYSFFPQADILGHNKTVLFISHCGFHGVMEAIHHVVPILGIPVFLDQKDNLNRLKQFGVSEGLDKESGANEIYNSIVNMLGNRRYKENMKILSKRVKMFGNSLEKAVWLLEHVMETGGAHHLKLSSRNLNLFRYLCLDVVLFISLILFACILIVFTIISKFMRVFREYNLKYKIKVS